jgi:hypothetical protein
MKLGKETEEKVYKFDAEFTTKEWKMLKDYGQKLILKDEGALVNYALNDILRKAVERHKK